MNQEELRAYKKEYYAAHKEERAAYSRKYYAAHKEEIAARQRKYYATHKEELLRYDVCKIIRKHKEDMADDPDRLTTDFILKMIKSEEAAR